MTAGEADDDGAAGAQPRPRRYVSHVRRHQADQTRERIIAAGVALVRGFDSWDWSGLTFRAVAQQAEVGERTVYRHFPNERGLHDAIMERLGEEAGVDYETLTLPGVSEVASRLFRLARIVRSGRRDGAARRSDLRGRRSEPP